MAAMPRTQRINGAAESKRGTNCCDMSITWHSDWKRMSDFWKLHCPRFECDSTPSNLYQVSNTHVCAVPATNLRIHLIQSLRVTKHTAKGLIQVFLRWYTMVSLDFSKGVDCVDSDLLGEHCGRDGVSLHLIWLPDNGLC